MPFWDRKNRAADEVEPAPATAGLETEPPLDRKPFWQAIWPVLACGAGLFSDGYVNNSIGSVTTTLTYQYGDVFTDSRAYGVVSAIAFAGTVVGQLVFGFLADHWSRTNSLLLSTVILIVFTALAAGSYYHDSPVGLFNILTAWRFFVGIGIGGEYPAGSVSCAESSGELKAGTRNTWFILFTNSMIDWGFVFGAFVPYVVAAAADNKYFGTIWRTSLGIGCVFPIVLFILRLRLKEPEEFSRNSMKHVKTPYGLVLKYYWFRLLIVSLIWFIYDFSVYAFGLYSSSILASIYGSGAPLTTVFGWNTVINLFYIPGTMIGAPISDRLGPRYTLILGQIMQSVLAFILAGCYTELAKPHLVGAFATVYGIFLSFGELGPGNNIGLLASKTCATGVRGQYYGVAAAMGKVGAFIGVYIFPYIERAGGTSADPQYHQYPFYVAASLNLLAAALALTCLPPVGQDTIALEDQRFRAHLESKGWDTRQLGLRRGDDVEGVDALDGAVVPRDESPPVVKAQ
ncbi:major facilitator superfamily domain-containing protein [Xylariaceae sp. FL0804]|nr:major facilitator superfamily domain-containing protein [Xylariaceae sp. FL0804]